MTRKRKFLIGGVVIAAALAYLIYAGVSQSVVYFVTPSEQSSRASPTWSEALYTSGFRSSRPPPMQLYST